MVLLAGSSSLAHHGDLVLLPGPLAFLLVDVLEVLVGKAALVHGVAVGDRRYGILVEHLVEDSRARSVEDAGDDIAVDILDDPVDHFSDMTIARRAGDEVVAQLSFAGGYVEFIPLGTEHGG